MTGGAGQVLDRADCEHRRAAPRCRAISSGEVREPETVGLSSVCGRAIARGGWSRAGIRRSGTVSPSRGGVRHVDAGPVVREGDRWRGEVVNRGRADDGGATVLACLALAGLIGATLLVSQVGVVVVARHRVQAAADLGALAAAGALEQGAEAGCAQAIELARRMRVRIRECEVAQWDATVTVEGNVPIGLFGNRTVRAVARAGPVEDGV